MSQEHIQKWVEQFEAGDQEFILNELGVIFKTVYFSKNKALTLIKKLIKKLTKQEGYSSTRELLLECKFLNLQEEGKSQGAIVDMVPNVMLNKFGYEFEEVEYDKIKHYIYVDDVLCTGNTFYNNIMGWLNEPGKRRVDKIIAGEIKLHIFYFFISSAHFDKKLYTIRKDTDARLSNTLIGYRMLKREHSKLLKPVEDALTSSSKAYIETVEDEVNEYAESKGWKASSGNYTRLPDETESLYSSSKARERFEAIMLEQGIKILEGGNASKSNVRPLGYSLPSYKDAGFGAMVFSWRNVPNNTPLAFWYRTSKFMPLFANKR